MIFFLKKKIVKLHMHPMGLDLKTSPSVLLLWGRKYQLSYNSLVGNSIMNLELSQTRND